MIIASFKGYTGNWLFQYAAAKAIAEQNQVPLKLDWSNYGDNNPGVTLPKFNVEWDLATPEESFRFTKKDLLYYVERLFPHQWRRFVYEKNDLFDKSIVGIKRKNAYLRGYFHSEKYFKEIEPLIRKEFTLREPLDTKYSELLEKMRGTDSVSIHIRRGDALTHGRPVTTLGYYKKAITLISDKLQNPHFFAFSDDITWVKENFGFLSSVTFVSQPTTREYEELVLMSRCKHNIITNSTFSWWGAWLNNNAQRIVIAPKEWIQDPIQNDYYTEHLLLPTWTILNT